MSQPAVSFAIKRMEESLGVRLFHRRHRGIALTDVGELVAGQRVQVVLVILIAALSVRWRQPLER